MKGTHTHEHIHETTFVPKLTNERTNLWLNECCSVHPSDVPHLSRLQPPFGSASSQAILLHLKAPGQPEGIPNECFSSWNRKRHWDTTLRYIINLTWENRRKSSCFRWPNGTRSFQQQCTLYGVSTSWSPPGKAGVNKYHLPSILMTNSFRTWILAHLETLPCSVVPH